MLDDKVIFIYNPYIRQLCIYFVDYDYITEKYFNESEEWIKVDHPHFPEQYLHIQLDYDEMAQLIIYYRQDNDESLHEDISDHWHSTGSKTDNIFIASSDTEYQLYKRALKHLEFYPKVKSVKLKDS